MTVIQWSIYGLHRPLIPLIHPRSGETMDWNRYVCSLLVLFQAETYELSVRFIGLPNDLAAVFYRLLVKANHDSSMEINNPSLANNEVIYSSFERPRSPYQLFCQ